MPMMPTSRSIPRLLDELARRFPQREALVGGDQRYTYASLRNEVRAFAKGLHALGVAKGDKVAILMGNKPEWIIADLAICLLGGIMVAVNTWATSRELQHILAHSDSTLLIASDRYLKYDYFAMLDELEPLARSMPLLRQVVHLGPRRYRDFDRVPRCVRARPRRRRCGRSTRRSDAVDPRDVAYILYTSGSTSTPKGVQLQHYALIENMWHIGERMHVTEHDRLWLAVSLFWGLGCENALFNLMTHGGCVVLQESFEPGEALRLISAERCTIFYGMPNMVQAIAEHPDRPKYDISCLRAGGTLGTPEQLRRIVELGVKDFSTIYGLTESYGNCTVADGHDPLEIRFATVGRPLPGVDLRIIDAATGREQPRGTVGEIRLKGLRDDRLLQGRGQEPRGVRRQRLFPHRRSRFPRRRGLPALPRAPEGDDQDRRHQRRTGRGRGKPAAASGGEARLRHRRSGRAARRGDRRRDRVPRREERG